ncbi:MAG: acyl-CoA dehydrogenase, partial [Alphaproteobacteria bacterium]
LNHSGDRQGVRYENGVVRTPDGFADAYRQYVEGGWNGVPFEPEHGGQGLPWLVAFALSEVWQSANMAWALNPVLTGGAVELLTAHGTPEQQRLYLPKLVSGEWTGTMNLTEPQAGSDVGALKTRAEPDGDRYRIRGQKIFITWGEHDLAPNIVHMVLARLPDAPPGTRGISLFLVPKFLVDDDGGLGPRNDLHCVSVEHKLGIHASPTCVMSFGENEGAIGWLVGEPNRGLAAMFTMMNNARLNVGIEGLALSERAYQQACAYAFERIQGSAEGEDGVPIIRHPDVRRMLLAIKAQTEAMRALVLEAGAALDAARRLPDGAAKRAAQARIDLMTPIVKAWCTDLGVELTSTALQVHGGMGFIEETGAAQHYRDARIPPIYEGTNGIQAQDLVLRKLLRDRGEAAAAYIVELNDALTGLGDSPAETSIRRHLAAGLDALQAATDWLLAAGPGDAVLAAATPYLRLFGIVAGGAVMARAAAVAAARLTGNSGDSAYAAKLATARFYAEAVLPQAAALLPAVTESHAAVTALGPEAFRA